MKLDFQKPTLKEKPPPEEEEEAAPLEPRSAVRSLKPHEIEEAWKSLTLNW